MTARAVSSQLLFTAGNSLTTKGFFYYFVNEFHPSARFLAVLQVAPESAELLGMLARSLSRWLRTRKRLWVGGLLLARLAAFAIPLSLLARGSLSNDALLVYILVCTLVWYACQGVAYVTYLSWLSNLVPSRNWGRFFARWNMASLVVAIIAPVLAGVIRDEFLKGQPAQWEAWSYGAVFVVGGLIATLSVLPMLTLPDVPPQGEAPAEQPERSAGNRIWTSLTSPRFLTFAMHLWWLSFFQGLTQSATFLYQVRILGIGTTTFYCMNGLMLALQIPLAIVGGRMSDAGKERRMIIVGLLLVSTAMGFWMAATPDRWWLLWGAYAVWGLFGVVNVCEQSLNLKLAPSGDNALHLSIVRQWGGAFTAIAGLLGGWWLDELTGGEITSDTPLVHFQTIFLVSWIGRATAPLWLLLPSQSKHDA